MEKGTIIELLTFLKAPHKFNYYSKFNSRFIFIVFFFCLPFNFLLGYIGQLNICKEFFGVTSNEVSKIISDKPFIIGFLLFGIILPVVEEFIFRYFLNTFWGSFFIFFGSIALSLPLLFSIDNKITTQVISPFIILIAIFIFIRINNSSLSKTKAAAFLNKYYPLFFYIICVSFGLVHLSNYYFNRHIIILPFTLVLPQIFMGMVFTYLRLRYGILSSIFLHILNNTFFFIFSYFLL